MAYGRLDVAHPDDDALSAWYRRPTEKIQRDKQLADAVRFAHLGAQVRQADISSRLSELEAGATVNRQTTNPKSTITANHYPSSPSRGSASRPVPSTLGDMWVARAMPERRSELRAPSTNIGQWPNRARNTNVAPNNTICRACHWGGGPSLPSSQARPSLPDKAPWGVPPASPWKQRPYSSPQPPRENPRQCAIQNMADSRKCVQQPNKVSGEMCWESAAEREAYCIKSGGEVGYPSLFTHD